ncbi:MAG: nucleoside triphosphate pyrophosphohydrolase [Fimbriimonadaceae bacterium]|nr:nucleoside triphosphate pyrophosphohydrolase [Fimbriimonadaceae bacterium]
MTRLGWKGSVQVHQAPTLLQPDQRAHQLFIGFESPHPVVERLLRLYPAATPVSVIAGDRRANRLLSEDLPWQADAVLCIPAMQTDHPGGFYGLVWIVDRLLGPGGCPWDQAQTHQSLQRHLIEEAYELIEAIDHKSDDAMIEELGDVLLQPLMHTQMKALAGAWDIEAPIRTLTEKLLRRHPHVFGDLEAADADEVLKNWDRIKREEKAARAEPESVLAGVPRAMPALMRAMEISKRAARAGFEWQDEDGVWDKVAEELGELREAVESGDPDHAADELGDLLFTLVNVARWRRIDPEEALRRMLDRFQSRFSAMEASADRPLAELSADEWDRLWVAAKSLASPRPAE